MLFWLVYIAGCCLAQTVIYTTGPNGETSAYLVVGNTTSATTSRSSSGSPATVIASTTSNFATVTNSPSTIMLPTAPYTGQSLLVGTCTIPMYTALRYADGHFIEVPLIGCSDDRPECCPSLDLSPSSTTSTKQSQTDSALVTPTGIISMLSQAPLTVCPSDMVDVDPVCCPHGFTKWSQAILGNTPCASLLSTSYPIPSSVIDSVTSAIAASATLSPGGSASAVASQSVTVIVNTVFALGLPCADNAENHHGLSTGAKAGIGVGVGLGVLLIILVGAWACLRIRRRRKNTTAQPQEQQVNRTDETKGYPSKMEPSTQWMTPATIQDSGYGQGFVDGVKAALSPHPGPAQSPPPLYGAPRVSAAYQPVEVSAESTRNGRTTVQDRAAELSASETNTRSSLV